MTIRDLYLKAGLALAGVLLPLQAQAEERASSEHIAQTGVSGLWLLANISYAGMRAQHNRSTGWRILAFIFGFPGTLITLITVQEGSCRAYGIEIPRRLDHTSE